ncbi:M20/M25/M40 family metallo-hydrolase [Halomarina oriensis]|uniref:M20/M25/M40 family metallo-hydrolase n=1 Tax=Halomarina oriensis TaxID=671145 RepID=A0A6B0GJC2_9EURY|nr:M20/M25/M40 family metallo-hydrolase [Halomarina oriensis]MWG34932.1 M20/M25/M40 family metallo-hydrolase [Halomarina oriensis]
MTDVRSPFVERYDAELRAFVERLVGFESTPGAEAGIQSFVREHLDALGFETYEWEADPERLAGLPSFPDDPAAIPTAGRPSVAGVLELGSGEGRTLVLNGHVDVVPASDAGAGGRDDTSASAATDGGAWRSDPFTATWSEDGKRLTARGAADMKSGLGACVYAARYLADRVEAGEADVDGRVVVESVAGEEEGGIGAASSALDAPYTGERDAVVVAEPTELRPVVASEGCLMLRLVVRGRSAHAATAWRGASALDRFEVVHDALRGYESDHTETTTHPLYDGYTTPWPVVVGTVRAGEWPSTVPARLTAETRIGVAPGESVDEVETAVRERLTETAREAGWPDALSIERFDVQFEPSEIAPDEPVVVAVQDAMVDHGVAGTDPLGVTYGADARHYTDAGVPAVLFGPGSIDQAHFPNETVEWDEVLTAGVTLSTAVERFLS